MPLTKWVAVPLTVFGFCYFVVGPILSGGPSGPRMPSNASTEVEAPADNRPIEPGRRDWTPVAPPQVSVTVTPMEEEEPIEQFDDASPPPVVGPPDGGGEDEAGIGGIAKPPPTGGDGDGRSMGSGIIGGDRPRGGQGDQSGVTSTTAGNGGHHS